MHVTLTYLMTTSLSHVYDNILFHESVGLNECCTECNEIVGYSKFRVVNPTLVTNSCSMQLQLN